MQVNIYVGNLSETAVEVDLRRAFEGHGRVTRVSIIRDARSGESRGFGYVEMPDAGEARTAIRAVHRRDVHGNPMAVEAARFQPPLVETQADFGDFAR